jgi:histidine phosphotransferase ChpT
MPSDLDLASLVASRLCHDVVGAVGAIQNGLELMAEDQAMADMAIDLIAKSTAQASARIQYARVAYGAAGGSTMLDPAEGRRLTEGLFAGEKAELDWQWDGPSAPRDRVKLAMLLAAYAIGAVPRGGRVVVTGEADEGVTVVAAGTNVRKPAHLDVITEGTEPSEPQAVQPLLVVRLAAALGLILEVGDGDDSLTIRARPSQS